MLIKKKTVSLTSGIPKLQNSFIWDQSYDNCLFIKPIIVGLCRSDIKEVQQKRGNKSQFGHELVGKVTDIKGKTKFNIGDIICLNPNIKIKRNTCFSELIIAEGEYDSLDKAFYKLADNKYYNHIFSEPLACSLHCINTTLNKLNISNFMGAKVGIIGAGMAGIFIGLSAIKKGAKVRIYNSTKNRINFLKSIGAFDTDILSNNLNSLDGSDILVIATAIIDTASFETALSKVKNNSSIILYGGTNPDTSFMYNNIDLDMIRRKEYLLKTNISGKNICLIGSYGTDKDSFTKAIKWLESDRLFSNIHNLITKKIKINELTPLLLSEKANENLGKTIIEF